MVGQCERHPEARAYTAWWRPHDKNRWQLCAHCAHQHGPTLLKLGYALVTDKRADLQPALAQS